MERLVIITQCWKALVKLLVFVCSGITYDMDFVLNLLQFFHWGGGQQSGQLSSPGVFYCTSMIKIWSFGKRQICLGSSFLNTWKTFMKSIPNSDTPPVSNWQCVYRLEPPNRERAVYFRNITWKLEFSALTLIWFKTKYNCKFQITLWKWDNKAAGVKQAHAACSAHLPLRQHQACTHCKTGYNSSYKLLLCEASHSSEAGIEQKLAKLLSVGEKGSKAVS